MNKWSHLLAAFALAVMAFVIHILIRADNNVNKLDVVRLYTMVREKPDVSLALSYLGPVLMNLPDLPCVQHLTPTTTCLAAKKLLRNNILTAMRCDKYTSQMCAYLGKVLNAVVSSTGTSKDLAVTTKITPAIPGQADVTYRQALYNAIQEAPNILHNGFTAKQDKGFIVLRTVLYNLITITALANIVVHISDTMPGWSWRWRLAMRVGYFLISFILSIIGLFSDTGTTLIVVVGMFIPAFISLIYFEIYLDDPDERPWVHPYTFAIIFVATQILALTENDVLNGTVMVVEILKAQAASQLYMQIVWFWTGYMEKLRLGSSLAEVYRTKQVQYALFMAIILVGLLPFLTYLAPYDYSNSDMFLRLAPLLFTGIAVIGTIYLQGLILDDHYGIDADTTGERERKLIGPYRSKEHREAAGESYHRQDITYKATRISGGKLGVSMLVLIFVALVEFEFVAEYFRTLRAYFDTMPLNSPQYDVLTKTYLWGGGLTTTSPFLAA